MMRITSALCRALWQKVIATTVLQDAKGRDIALMIGAWTPDKATEKDNPLTDLTTTFAS